MVYLGNIFCPGSTVTQNSPPLSSQGETSAATGKAKDGKTRHSQLTRYTGLGNQCHLGQDYRWSLTYDHNGHHVIDPILLSFFVAVVKQTRQLLSEHLVHYANQLFAMERFCGKLEANVSLWQKNFAEHSHVIMGCCKWP